MQTAYKSVRVFKNPFLEKFTHIHPILPLVSWAPVIAWLLWRSVTMYHHSFSLLAALALGGIVTWTLTEYVLHRFLFHFEPNGPFQERLVFILHGIHHADPVDPTRLVMPPLVSFAMAYPIFLGFRALMGATYAEPFFAFFVVGYLCYDYLHYAVHHFKPRTRLGKYLKQSHMIHHYVNPETRWGVSCPLWDVVFGTYHEAPRPMKVTRVGHGS